MMKFFRCFSAAVAVPARVSPARRFRTLWGDDRGSVTAVSLLLLTSVLTMGTVIGLVTLRDHVLQQYGDMAVGLDEVDQSFSYSAGIDLNGDGDFVDAGECVLTGSFVDTNDPNMTDPASTAPADIMFTP